MLQFLNVFFFVFHTAWMLFNIFGWIWKKTRLWNLYTIILTFASWFILGIWYGLGYCACTAWHWSVREKMGIHDESESYTHFLILKLTGVNLPQQTVDYMTLGLLLSAAILSVWLNVRDWRKRKAVVSAT